MDLPKGFWPGDGTYVIAAEDARAFTVHEFAKPVLRKMGDAKASDQDWLKKLRADLTAMAEAADRDVTPDDFVWAASARCRCGAGYVYPEFIRGTNEHWFCSASLLGIAPVGSEHDCAKPFAFWKIKSDRQPSAAGQTTRPPQEDVKK